MNREVESRARMWMITAVFVPMTRRLDVTLGRPGLPGEGDIPARIGPLALEPYAWINGLISELVDRREATTDLLANRVATIGEMIAQAVLASAQRARLAERSQDGDALLVVSNESWVPWEMLAIDTADGPTFLGHRFAMTRGRFDRELVDALPLSRLAVVAMPSPDLEGVPAEAEALLARARDGLAVEHLLPRHAWIRAALTADSYDGWHFAGHHRTGSPSDVSGFKLEGADALTSADLAGANGHFARRRPLVFLNACNTGRAGLSLAGPGGLAERFVALGAGAVVATRWAIADRTARSFADATYDRFLAGATLGEAVRQSRLEIVRNDPNDVHGFAYTVFAHPFATRSTVRPDGEPLVIPTPPALPGLDAEARAYAALAAIGEELVDHLVSTATLISGYVELLGLNVAADRHVLETDADYRRRQLGEWTAHRASIGLLLDRFPLAFTVLTSHRRDLAVLGDTGRREAVERCRHHLVEARERITATYQALLAAGTSPPPSNRRPAERRDDVLQARRDLTCAAGDLCLVIEEGPILQTLEWSLRRAGIELAMAPGKAAWQQSRALASRIEQQRATELGSDLEHSTAEHASVDRAAALSDRPGATERPLPELILDGGLAFLDGKAERARALFQAALEQCGIGGFGRQFLERSIERLESPEAFGGGGLVVLQLHPGGRLEQAGVTVGDVLLKVDKTTLSQPIEIAAALGQAPTETRVVDLLRDQPPFSVAIRGGAPLGGIVSRLGIWGPVQL